MRHVILFLLASSLILGACKTEDEIVGNLAPGKVGAEAMYRWLPLSHLLNHFIQPYQSTFIPSYVKIKTIDSVTTDGDGFQFDVHFGAATTLPDGFVYKNVLHLLVSDTQKSYLDTGTVIMEQKDSFAIQSENGLQFYSGFFSWRGISTDSVLINANLRIDQGGLSYNLVIKNQVILLTRQGAINNYIHGVLFSGKAQLILEGNTYEIDASEMEQLPGCNSNWVLGSLSVNAASSDKWDVDLNPFGNKACDKVYKVSKKSKNGKYEVVFTAW